MTMTTLHWESLPASTVTTIEDHTGPVIKAETITTGLMPGLAAVLHTGTARYFLKAAPHDNPAYHLYAREHAANTALPPGSPAPPMLLAADTAEWLVMVFQYVDAPDADLSPGSPDLPGILATLAAINSVPAPGTAPPVTANVTALTDKAAALLAKHPDGHPWDMYAAAIDGFTADALTGTTLVHYDLHPGNLKVTGNGVLALDWAFACAGTPWTDAALLTPRLIEAGHSPASADSLMSRHPAWKTAPPAAVTALGALWTIFREYKAQYGPQHARPYREQAARAGRSWITYRMS
jgi:aminoglycoside phosphotransferase (APT) family kinase protein